MANNVVGYIGTDNYEILLYLSRILSSIGKKVLMIDYTTSRSLAACIPVPVGLSPLDDLIDYRRTDFTMKAIRKDELQSYDDVLIDYGFNLMDNLSTFEFCNNVALVTDLQKINIEKLARVPAIDISEVRKQLIIKDFVESKINQEYILDMLKDYFFEDNVYVFDLDETDTRCRILTQFDNKFEFKHISREIKRYLKETVKTLHPEISEKVLLAAYKNAERGN